MIEIMARKHPSDVHQLIKAITDKFPDHPLLSIATCCLDNEAENRPSVDMIGSYLVKQTMAYTCKQVQDKEAKNQQLTYQSLKEQVHKMISAPNPIKRSSDAVIDHVHSIVYLRQANEKKVYAFNLRMDSWKQLPDCNNFQCTLAFFEDNLLAIGETPEDTSPRTSKVYKLVQQSGWETKSSMLTARSRTTALTCDFNKESVLIAVSYTHLTLPTLYSV